MKQFERTDTLFIRCAPELKQAIEMMRSKWGTQSVSDIVHNAVAREFRTANINADIFGPTVNMSDEAIREFAERLGDTEHRAEKRKRLTSFERSQLRELKRNQQKGMR